MTEVVEIALFTDDAEATRAFYERLLGSAPESEWAGGAIFAAGRVQLLVHARGEATENGPPNQDHFALGVLDLDRACEELRERGFAFLVEPRDFDWGRSAYLRDPDGRLVELSQI